MRYPIRTSCHILFLCYLLSGCSSAPTPRNTLASAAATDLDNRITWLLKHGAACLNTYPDSSFSLYQEAAALADSAKVLSDYPEILYSLATCYQLARDYPEAVRLFDSARSQFTRLKRWDQLSNCFCALGSILFDMADPGGAKRSYDTALQIARAHRLGKQTGVALANLSKFESDPGVSIRMQQEAVRLLWKKPGTGEEVATILTNIGSACEDPDTALHYHLAALAMADSLALKEVGLGALNNMTYAYLDRGDAVTAERILLTRAIPVALKDSNYDWLSTLYDTYADVLLAQKRFREAFAFERKSMQAREEFEKIQGASQVRLLFAVLDLKNKELMISEKTVQVATEQGKNRRLRIWLAGALAIILVIAVTAVIIHQRSRLRLQRQRIESANRILDMEEREKQRVGKELHDLTGQVMMGIKGELEKAGLGDPGEADALFARIREIGEGIREVSHRLARPGMQLLSFHEMMTDLVEGYRRSLGMNILLLLAPDLALLPPETVQHLYRIVQEMLTNAGKYARESQVSLDIKADRRQISLFYSDEGPGFDKERSGSSGMGISGIFERVRFLGGKAHLDSEPGAGTWWEISIPLRPSKN